VSRPVIKIEDAKLISGDPRIAVTSPYLAEFVQGARKLGGKWSETSRRWLFDPRDRREVEALLTRCYGASTSEGVALCTLRVTLPTDGSTYDCRLSVAGKTFARTYGRDSGAKMPDGCRVLAGRLYSAGSRKNPTLSWNAGTVVLVRDVLLTAARDVDGASDAVVEQVEEETPTLADAEVQP
jgi:hypothetical protein